MNQAQWLRPEINGNNRPLTAVQVEDAYLSKFAVEKGVDRDRLVTGAVYRGRDLVIESVRQGGVGGDLVISADPIRVDRVANPRRLNGRWLYGGNWMNQFGHFILETLSTLWPSGTSFEGILFHPFLFGNRPLAWQYEFLERLDIPPKMEIVLEDVEVESLVVPERAVVLNKSVSSEARDVWHRIANRRTELQPPVFFSRSMLDDDVRSFENDTVLDNALEAMGIRVVHPENLALEEQLQIVADSEIIIGLSGSALHLSAFAPPHTPTIEVGDRRTRGRPVPAQAVLDASMGRMSAFVPVIETSDGQRDIQETVESIGVLLGAKYPKFG